jgi:hypothetical protein
LILISVKRKVGEEEEEHTGSGKQLRQNKGGHEQK